MDADVIVVGAGLAGLAAAAEAAEAGRRVLLLDQEPEQSLGGQAWWSFGGLFFVGSPQQRRLRVRDSVDLAWQDWLATAGFDRMWHYVEGVANHGPVWPLHGIRILPGPSSLWLDATGRRLPVPLYPGSDTLGTLEYLRGTGHDHSWFILTRKIIAREFALSGSEQNPDLTGRDRRAMLASRFGGGVPGPVQAHLDRGADFVTAATLPGLGLHTDLSSRVLGASGDPVPGLYAAGEAAGFGGGGMHGYRSLEGTFLGGCLFSGRVAGRAAAAATA